MTWAGRGATALALVLCGCGTSAPKRRPAPPTHRAVPTQAQSAAAPHDGGHAADDAGHEPDAAPDATFAVHFTEVAEQAGLTYVQAPTGIVLGCDDLTPMKCPFTSVHMSGGAAAGDFDRDGLLDLFVTRLDMPGILYRNRGDGTFEDVTERYGLETTAGGNGAGWADIDNDGDLDLYVTNVLDKRFYLFVNDGDRFLEQGAARGADVATDYRHHGFSVAFGDYDRDGFLDLHVTEWLQIALDNPVPSHARLLHNRGRAAPGFFDDVTDTAGVDLLQGVRGSRTSYTSSFSDMDGDGWPELLVVADFSTSRLFWNDRGAFTDGTLFSHVGSDQNGMGSAIGDYDGDGDMDWFVTAIYDPNYMCGNTELCGWGTTGNRLYRNQGGRSFEDATDPAGVRDGGWGWGAAFVDYDNDGDLDLVMTNGVDFPYPEAALFRSDPMRVWRNQGDGTFTDAAAEVGIDDRGDGKGLLVFDYDDDGDEDLLVVQHEGPPRLYRNDGGNRRSWLRVRLEGNVSNHDGVGARVAVTRQRGDAPLVRDIPGAGQFLGQSEMVAHFGLGDFAQPLAEVRVDWPSGRRQVLHAVAVGQTLVLHE
jgi:hypothetical protein